MRTVALSLFTLVCTLATACGGDGGGDLTGEVAVPEGYVQFRGAGVSFVYPKGWRVEQRTTADGVPSVEVTPPDQGAGPGPLILLSITPRAGARFDSLLDQRKVVIEAVNNGRIASEEEVELAGAKRAQRTTSSTPPGQRTGGVEVKAESVNLVRDNDDVVGLVAATPLRGDRVLDAEAVIDSFRLVDSA